MTPTAYDRFCTLRDQRRAGEEAPEHTEKRAFEIAVFESLNIDPKRKLIQIHDALCNHLGDTEPQLDPDMSDEEVQVEYPVFWAAMEIAALIGHGSWDTLSSTAPAAEETGQ